MFKVEGASVKHAPYSKTPETLRRYFLILKIIPNLGIAERNRSVNKDLYSKLTRHLSPCLNAYLGIATPTITP